jgi:hypothetical protein
VFEHYEAVWNELTAEGGFAVSEIEVRGNPMRVFPNAPATMRSIWEIAQFHGDKPYVVYEDEHYTYAEIGAQVRALAHYLRDVHGIGKGAGLRSRAATTPSGSCRTGPSSRSERRPSG